MSYALFLDDERNPWDVTWIKLPRCSWHVVRSFDAFVEKIREKGIPSVVSFDHDLVLEHNPIFEQNPHPQNIHYESYKEKTGWHAAKWLKDICFHREADMPQCFVHSQNPWGAKNILKLLGQPVTEETVLSSGIIIPKKPEWPAGQLITESGFELSLP